MSLYAIAIALLGILYMPLQADVLSRVKASGLGYISTGDLAAAFAQAKKAAMREAVELGVGTLISAETRVDNFSVLEDYILSRTDGYIRSYEIIKHGLIDEETYQVDIEAVVELGNLHQRLDALELLITHAGNPYIMCIGRDVYTYGEEGTRDLSATLLRGYLLRKSARFNLSAPMRIEDGSLDQAASVGFQQGADIVVRVEALVGEVPDSAVPFSGTSLKGLGLYSATAEIRVEALWTDTGEIFASLVHSERGADVNLASAGDKALRSGMEKISGKLISRLAENWREKMYSGRLVRLVVVGEFDRMGEFENAFPFNVSGVEKIYRRSYNKGVAVFDIRCKETGFTIARDITAKGIEGIDLDIVQVSPNRIQLQILN